MIYATDQDNCVYQTLAIPTYAYISSDMIENIRLSLTMLLNTKSQYFGTLFNPLSALDMRFSGVDISGTTMNIYLSGVNYRTDDTCLNSEARDQVWATAYRYADPSLFVIIWINNVLFDDVILNG